MKQNGKKWKVQGSPLPLVICGLPELNIPLPLLQQCIDAVTCSCNRDLHNRTKKKESVISLQRKKHMKEDFTALFMD
jgi:hypothetical protein